MRYRSNDKVNLTNNFAQTPETVDEITLVWPNLATPIDDPTRYDAGQQALVPSLGRTIRANHFNRLADSVCSIQHFLSENIGMSISMSGGTASLCEDVWSTVETGQLTSNGYETGSGLYIAQVSSTATGVTWDLDLEVDEYNFTHDVTIPALFGEDPWSNKSFFVHVEPRVQAEISGFWSGNPSLASAIERFNKTPFVITSIAPSPVSPTTVRIYGKIIQFGDTGDANSFSWAFGQTLQGSSINSSSSCPVALSLYKNDPATFRVYTDTDPIGGKIYGPRAGSLGRVGVWPTIDWAGFKKLGIPQPYGDKCRMGANGGILYHKQNTTREADAFVEFSWHGWGVHKFVDNILGGGDKHICKSGVFLRLSRSPISNSATGSLGDYTKKHQYSGYLLRLGANRVAQGTTNDETQQAGIAEFAIMRVENEQFGVTEGEMDYFWDRAYTGASNPSTGVTYDANSDAPYGDCPPGSWTVLAYGSEPLVPIIGRNGNTPTDSPQKWVYRFEIEGATLRVLKRLITDSAWTLIDEVTDADPIPVSTDTPYKCAGIYSKGLWKLGYSSNSGNDAPEHYIYFSNIRTGVLSSSNISNVPISLKLLFFAGPDTL